MAHLVRWLKKMICLFQWWFSRPQRLGPKYLGRIPFLPLTLTANNNCKLLLNDGYMYTYVIIYICMITIICMSNIIIIVTILFTNKCYSKNHHVSQCVHGFSEIPNWWTARGQSQNLRLGRSISAAKMKDHASNMVVLSLPPWFQHV